jgi:hypothetical protein
MKFLALVFAALLPWSVSAFAQEVPDLKRVEFVDVIFTSDGSVWRGLIVEQVPGQTYKIALAGGSVKVVAAAEVTRIAKERNPDYQPVQAPVAPPVAGPVTGPVTGPVAPAPLPPPASGPGLRLGAAVGLAFPTGDFSEDDLIETSVALAARVGYEFFVNERFALTPAARVRLAWWRLNDEVDNEGGDDIRFAHIHAGGELRAAVHIGSVAPYGSVGLGLDVNATNLGEVLDVDINSGLGVGLDLEAGLEALVSPNLALGFGFLIHPGFSPTTDLDDAPDVTFWGLVLAMEFRQ